MKPNRMTLLSEINDQAHTVHLMEAVKSALMTAGQRPSKFRSKNKISPRKIATAASSALDSYASYKRNQMHTIRLFAKTPYETKMMTSIVDVLSKGGNFKIDKIRFTSGGGRLWIIRKK